MRSAQEIYDSTPFEDENGLIPHDKLAVKVAEEYAGQFNQWVSVDQILPLDGSYILVKAINIEIAYFEVNKFFYDADCELHFGTWVTHWMPLPNPPQPC